MAPQDYRPRRNGPMHAEMIAVCTRYIPGRELQENSSNLKSLLLGVLVWVEETYAYRTENSNVAAAGGGDCFIFSCKMTRHTFIRTVVRTTYPSLFHSILVEFEPFSCRVTTELSFGGEFTTTCIPVMQTYKRAESTSLAGFICLQALNWIHRSHLPSRDQGSSVEIYQYPAKSLTALPPVCPHRTKLCSIGR